MEQILTAYLKNSLHQPVCTCVPYVVTRQRLNRDISAATNTRNNMRIAEGVVYYIFRVITKGKSVGRYVYPPTVTRQRLSKHVSMAKNNS